MRVAIITISDSVSAGKTSDRSGPSVRARCRELHWEIAAEAVVPDDEPAIRERLVTLADSDAADLIFTTGGTGIGPRDVTPEVTSAVCSRLLPGFAEHMRLEGMKANPRAILSRAVCGVRSKALIINLPGSPRGAVESLNALADLLPHASAVLHGARHD
ncbi:MAG: MogA/MoaB family molybdenum cofactor biosynthesis protein [Candidatus Acidiferrales bacterium]